jgi:hypothetical protein
MMPISGPRCPRRGLRALFGLREGAIANWAPVTGCRHARRPEKRCYKANLRERSKSLVFFGHDSTAAERSNRRLTTRADKAT